jgi:hypothetical protein
MITVLITSLCIVLSMTLGQSGLFLQTSYLAEGILAPHHEFRAGHDDKPWGHFPGDSGDDNNIAPPPRDDPSIFDH